MSTTPNAAQKHESGLSHAEILALFVYSPSTGDLMWRVSPARRTKVGDIVGSVSGNLYRRVSIRGRLYMAHRVIFNYMTGGWPDGQIDHRDRDKRNNAWSNLRDVTQSQNQMNTGLRQTNSSGVTGVSRQITRGTLYWTARMLVDGKRQHLCTRKNKQEAIDMLRDAQGAI